MLSIASASIGIPIALGAAVYILWRPAGWRRLWVVAVPIAVYALWYLGYGKSSIKRENLTAAPSYTADEVAGAVSAVAGLSIDWGRALAVAAVGGLLWHLSRVRLISRSFAMLLVAAFSFWVLTALARADLNEPAAPRYLYPGGLFVLLIAVEAVRGWRPSRLAYGVLGVGVLFAVLAGLGTFHDGANGLRFTDRIVKAEITPLEIGAGVMPASFQPDTAKAPQISAGPYLAAVRDIGSSPAYTEAELSRSDDGQRALADGVFVRGYGLTLAADTAPAQGFTACVHPQPVAGGVEVAIPAGGISLRAPGAQVTLRRFASTFSLPPLTDDAFECGPCGFPTLGPSLVCARPARDGPRESLRPVSGWRTHWRDIAGAVVSIGALAAVVVWALGQPAPRFPSEPGKLALLFIAVGVYALATLLRGWRWDRVLRSMNIGHRKGDAYSLVCVGYMGNNVLPARGGELLRVMLMAPRTQARRRELLGSVIAERVLDVVALAGLFAVMTLASVAGSPVGKAPA